jgi:hypothetical protein
MAIDIVDKHLKLPIEFDDLQLLLRGVAIFGAGGHRAAAIYTPHTPHPDLRTQRGQSINLARLRPGQATRPSR